MAARPMARQRVPLAAIGECRDDASALGEAAGMGEEVVAKGSEDQGGDGEHEDNAEDVRFQGPWSSGAALRAGQGAPPDQIKDSPQPEEYQKQDGDEAAGRIEMHAQAQEQASDKEPTPIPMVEAAPQRRHGQGCGGGGEDPAHAETREVDVPEGSGEVEGSGESEQPASALMT